MPSSFAIKPIVYAAAIFVAGVSAVHAAGISGQGTWEATLQPRYLTDDHSSAPDAYYDTDLDITWLADANYAATKGYLSNSLGTSYQSSHLPDGYLTWDEAQTFVHNLDVRGISGWRLPDVKPVNKSYFQADGMTYDGTSDESYNITSTQSELAHMYYVTLGHKGAYSLAGDPNTESESTNSGPFQNLLPYTYWSGTEYFPPNHAAWAIGLGAGYQEGYDKDNGLYVWAVHSGDIAAVPEPGIMHLMLLGLIALGTMTYRRTLHKVRIAQSEELGSAKRHFRPKKA